MDLSLVIAPSNNIINLREITALKALYASGDYSEFIANLMKKEFRNAKERIAVKCLSDLIETSAENIKEYYDINDYRDDYFSHIDSVVDSAVNEENGLKEEDRDYFYKDENYQYFLQRQELFNGSISEYDDYVAKYDEGFRYVLQYIDGETKELKNIYYLNEREVAIDLYDTYNLSLSEFNNNIVN